MRFANFNTNRVRTNKKNYIIIGIIALIVLLFVIMFFVSKSNQKAKDMEAFSNNFENNATVVAIKPPPPPSLEYDEKKISQITNNADVSKKIEEVNATKETQEDNNKQGEISEIEAKSIEIVEKIKENNKTNPNKQNIRPEDMIVYLKAKQNEFFFDKNDKTFVFDNQTYKKSDKFEGWWFIEDITNVFIRFVDEESGYAYNLRFLEDNQ